MKELVLGIPRFYFSPTTFQLFLKIFLTDLVCGNETLKDSKQEKVQDVTIENRLNFGMHL